MRKQLQWLSFDHALIFFAMFITGLASLLYEVVLISAITTVIGVTETSTALVISTFLLGLALGALIGGDLSRRKLPHREIFFALEIAIAAFGFSFLFLLGRLQHIRFAFGGPFIFIALPLILLVLLLPTLMMGVEIPLAVRLINRSRKSAGRDAGFVYFADTLGGVIGSLGTGIVLVPMLGFFGSMFLGGWLNLTTALCISRVNRPRNWKALAAIGLFFVLGPGILIATHAQQYQLQLGFFNDLLQFKPLHAEFTPYQHVVIAERPPYGRAMFLDGHMQVVEKDSLAYHEYLVLPALAAHGPVQRALVIGGGDGGALYQLLQHNVTQVDHVDLDRRVVELAQQYLPGVHHGSLSDPRVHRTIMDGRRFLAEAQPGTYDLIIIDLPNPATLALTPLYSKEFYELVLRALAPGGIAVTQATTPYFYPRAFSSIDRTMATVFSSVAAYAVSSPAFTSLGYVMASTGTDVRSVRDPRVHGAWYDAADHAALLTLPPRVKTVLADDNVAVSTDSNPVIVLYAQPWAYIQDVLDPD